MNGESCHFQMNKNILSRNQTKELATESHFGKMLMS